MPSKPDETPATPELASTTIPGPIRMILAVLVFTGFVMLLNETTLAVALPSIMADYSIPEVTAQWLLTGFMLTMAVVLPVTGWLLDRFTTRTVFVLAAASFLFGTVLAALAPTFPVLLGARIAQAVGTAIIMPLLMTVTMTLVPVLRRGTVMGLIGVVMAAGPALGPTVAGLVLSVASWHGIFWVMVPLVATAAVLGAVKLTNVGEQRTAPFDVLSVVLSLLAFGSLVYGLSSVGIILDGGRDGLAALGVLVVGVISTPLFVWRQLAQGRKGRALLDLRPLAIRNYTLALLVMLFLFGAMLGVLNTLPLYLQGSLLVSALVTGLALLPGGALEALLSPFAGRFYDRYGPRPLLVTGMVISVSSLFVLSTVDEHTSLALVIAMHVAFSVALAMVFAPIMTTALGSLPRHLYGHGSAILNTLQQLAGAAGTAVMIGIYGGVAASARAAGAPETTAFAQGASAAFLACAITAGVALVLSLFVTRVPAGVDEHEIIEPPQDTDT